MPLLGSIPKPEVLELSSCQQQILPGTTRQLTDPQEQLLAGRAKIPFLQGMRPRPWHAHRELDGEARMSASELWLVGG